MNNNSVILLKLKTTKKEYKIKSKIIFYFLVKIIGVSKYLLYFKKQKF